MKKAAISLFALMSFIGLRAQTYHSTTIPKEWIVEGNGDSRAGSCASPDGDIYCDSLTDYPPDFDWEVDNGCCYTISPPVKNATYCYEFIAINTSVELNCGWSILVFAGFSSWFSDFNLYNCTPDCSLVGTGLTFTGLTVGNCYTWCFKTHMSGGGAGGGFDMLCPYVIQTPLLPVELVSFTAFPNAANVLLTWSTSSETNCESFAVLRSFDGTNFEEIGSVPGNGTTTAEHTYFYTDSHPLQGLNYYMLKEIDGNSGGSTNSDIIACTFGEEILSTNYFNLVGELVDFTEASSGMYIEEIITASGRSRHLVQK